MSAAISGETIFAMASGAGRAAIAVMRISGPESGPVLDALCSPHPRPPARRASLRRLRGSTGEVLDQAMVLWFPGPASYTGEDCAELHLHGGHAVLEGVAERLSTLGGRPAEPGEFTRRAFLNGRMDLIQAEAVADLVEAETSAQRQQAMRQLEGALGRLYAGWAEALKRLLAHQEALIDFPDEDLPPEVEAGVVREIERLRQEITAHLDDDHRGERVRDGLVFAVTGPPNVGKSSLINALAGRDVAIVSPSPGTTRDIIEARVVLAGIPVILVDTAGLRATEDPVEAEGVRRARARAEQADLVIEVCEALPDLDFPAGESDRVLHVANKVDLLEDAWAGPGVPSSVQSPAGVDLLRQRLESEAKRLTATAGAPPLTRARHRAAMAGALTGLHDALRAVLPELRAEDLRLALHSLGRATGEVDIEELLDVIFAQFCIGK